MKAITTLIVGASLMALQGCTGGPSAEPEEIVTNESAVSTGSANIALGSSWSSGYCVNVNMTNGLNEATARWQVLLDLKTSTITSSWGATLNGKSGRITATPVNYNTNIAPGGAASFGFCASAPNATVRPVIVAWNMESNVYATCPTNSGLFPTKAALAVAMATELGRWDAANDIVAEGYSRVALSASALARCGSGCKNTKALLGQQDSSISSFIDQNQFNPTTLATDLASAIGRQKNLISSLQQNNPSALPPAHKLTLVGGPTNLGKGNCGPHYIYQVDKADGTPLTSAQASAMANALCFYGQGSCGGNPYLAFGQVTAGCPSGRTCVAIDPTDGDNGSTSTTTAGSAPTYPMNRVYDPSNSLLGTQCITTRGVLGTLVSKCNVAPTTCGYLYCMP